LQDEFADSFLRGGISDRTQQREAATVAVHDVHARGKRDVPAGAAFPDREADQLESVERAIGEVQFCIGELAWRVRFVVRNDLDDHDLTSSIGAFYETHSARCCWYSAYVRRITSRTWSCDLGSLIARNSGTLVLSP